MTCDEQIAKMKKAIKQAIRVMKAQFGSTEKDVTEAIEELRASLKVDGVQATPLLRRRTLLFSPSSMGRLWLTLWSITPGICRHRSLEDS